MNVHFETKNAWLSGIIFITSCGIYKIRRHVFKKMYNYIKNKVQSHFPKQFDMTNVNERLTTCHDDVCAICLNKSLDETLLEFKCKHTYHKKCIIAWVQIRPICPLCRTNIVLKKNGIYVCDIIDNKITKFCVEILYNKCVDIIIGFILKHGLSYDKYVLVNRIMKMFQIPLFKLMEVNNILLYISIFSFPSARVLPIFSESLGLLLINIVIRYMMNMLFGIIYSILETEMSSSFYNNFLPLDELNDITNMNTLICNVHRLYNLIIKYISYGRHILS